MNTEKYGRKFLIVLNINEKNVIQRIFLKTFLNYTLPGELLPIHTVPDMIAPLRHRFIAKLPWALSISRKKMSSTLGIELK